MQCSLSFSLETYYRSRFRRPLTINHTRIHKGHHMAQLGKQIFILTSIQIDLKPVHKVQISADDNVPFSDEAFNLKKYLINWQNRRRKGLKHDQHNNSDLIVHCVLNLQNQKERHFITNPLLKGLKTQCSISKSV